MLPSWPWAVVPEANAQSRTAMMVDGVNWFILSTDISGLNWYHIQQTRHLLYKNKCEVHDKRDTNFLNFLFSVWLGFSTNCKKPVFCNGTFKAFFLTLARLFWNTIIACCSCRISRYHVRDDSMENCKEYCDVKATVYVILVLILMLTPASPPFQVRQVFYWSSEEIGNNIDIVLNSNKNMTRPGLDVKLPIKLTLIINSFVLWKIYIRQYQCYF